MPPVLHIDNLGVSFSNGQGQHHALRNASFSVNRGEIVALVGESGSGKSVTALSVLQLLPPDTTHYAGSIWFAENGRPPIDLLKAGAGQLRSFRGGRIGMIFQEPMTSLNPVTTCGKQVMEAVRIHRRMTTAAAREKTIALFEKVQLPDPTDMFNRYPHQLSGGQKQRVMIAMAMSAEPALLICDEPTTALDVTVQQTILELIRTLQRETGMAVIFITHDLALVAEIADRVVVMYQGNIVEQGNVQTIMLHPSHPYTQALLACRPELHRRGDRLPVVADFLGNDDTAKSVYPTAVVKGKDTDLTGTIPSPGILLEVKHLSVWFPEQKSFTGRVLRFSRAVDDVSFAVQRGETLGLVGESGCGKTTLSRALLRLIEPTSGEIIFNGHNWLQYPPATLRSSRKQLQIIFQDPYSALNPSITVGNALMEVLRVHYPQDPVSVRRRRVADLLAKVGLLPEHANRYPHAFSGGQRQRVVIARALATSPSFLICDESVSALDVSVQAQVLNLLNDLKKEFGFTIIFISHNLSVVHYISDRIMVMQQGKIVETGTADQVYHHPTEAYTRRLIAAIPEIPAAAGSRRQDFLQHPGTLP